MIFEPISLLMVAWNYMVSFNTQLRGVAINTSLRGIDRL